MLILDVLHVFIGSQGAWKASTCVPITAIDGCEVFQGTISLYLQGHQKSKYRGGVQDYNVSSDCGVNSASQKERVGSIERSIECLPRSPRVWRGDQPFKKAV
jgi:hypothetical protein